MACMSAMGEIKPCLTYIHTDIHSYILDFMRGVGGGTSPVTNTILWLSCVIEIHILLRTEDWKHCISAERQHVLLQSVSSLTESHYLTHSHWAQASKEYYSHDPKEISRTDHFICFILPCPNREGTSPVPNRDLFPLKSFNQLAEQPAMDSSRPLLEEIWTHFYLRQVCPPFL